MEIEERGEVECAFWEKHAYCHYVFPRTATKISYRPSAMNTYSPGRALFDEVQHGQSIDYDEVFPAGFADALHDR